MDTFMRLAADPAAWVALATLVVMEVMLGIDNLIFISILTNRLPAEQRSRARRIGIGGALVLRLALLGTAFIVTLTQPRFSAFAHGFSWRDPILIAGGLSLVWKATKEIHHDVDPEPDDMFSGGATVAWGFASAIGQIGSSPARVLPPTPSSPSSVSRLSERPSSSWPMQSGQSSAGGIEGQTRAKFASRRIRVADGRPQRIRGKCHDHPGSSVNTARPAQASSSLEPAMPV